MMKMLKWFAQLGNVVRLMIGIALVGYSIWGMAATGYNYTISSIAGHVGQSVVSLGQVMQDLSLVAGIGFILVSFFKFHQHKLNPTQVPISQGITLLVIGAALTLFPRLLETPASALLGSKASVAKVSSNEISQVIGTAQ